MKSRDKKVVVAVIGGKGKYGKWLRDFFRQFGCIVIWSDIGTELTNQQVVERADVIIFAVPIDKTVAIIKEVVPFSRKGQLFMDVTSIKSPATAAMMESLAEVVGLHPMCAPPLLGQTLFGQVIVRCDMRLSDAWRSWVGEVLKATEARVKISSPVAHDCCMSIVQGLTHAVALIMAAVIRTMGIDVREISDYISPPYKIALMVVGRILKQESPLYRDIQMSNEEIRGVLEALERETRRFRAMIEAKDGIQFVTEFEASRKHLGEKEVEESDSLFLKVVKFIATTQSQK